MKTSSIIRCANDYLTYQLITKLMHYKLRKGSGEPSLMARTRRSSILFRNRDTESSLSKSSTCGSRIASYFRAWAPVPSLADCSASPHRVGAKTWMSRCWWLVVGGWWLVVVVLVRLYSRLHRFPVSSASQPARVFSWSQRSPSHLGLQHRFNGWQWCRWLYGKQRKDWLKKPWDAVILNQNHL